jgi:post-segregation antitoxin (ccd killing protein)
MSQADSDPKTIITVDLDIDTIKKAELLGLNLSEMANRLLLAEVQRLEQLPGYHEAQIAPPP